MIIETGRIVGFSYDADDMGVVRIQWLTDYRLEEFRIAAVYPIIPLTLIGHCDDLYCHEYLDAIYWYRRIEGELVTL